MKLDKLILNIQHIGLPTKNLRETITFYQGLGFEIVYQMQNKVTGKKGAFLKCKDIMIETYENENAEEKPGALDHIALSVADIDETFRQVKDRYDMIDSEVQFRDFWEKGVRFFTIWGPNKEKIEFSQIL